MLRKEIAGVLKTKRAWIFILIIIIIPLIDLYMVCEQDRVWEKRANKEEILEIDAHLKEICEEEGANFTSGWIIHPAKASYLSGSSGGHLTQTLLIWLMPLFVLNLVSDRYILEYRRGYTNAVITRASKKKYIANKLFSSFLIPTLVFGVSLLLNFIVAQIIFADGYNFNGMEIFAEEGGWFRFMYKNPNIVYLLYIFITSIVAGICGVISQCIALISKKYTVTYLLAFFLWMGLVMIKYSIIYLIQPFTEYGIDYMLRSGGILIAITVLFLVLTCVYKVKKDVL